MLNKLLFQVLPLIRIKAILVIRLNHYPIVLLWNKQHRGLTERDIGGHSTQDNQGIHGQISTESHNILFTIIQ
ncbi:hypothetical protein SAMN06266787_1097 [Halorubrum ezzemoulense]|uniref:Uncharacterized protein n=1 Tax=Halorubrum ezzemoulense TaxID=337243 RepID=A0A238Y6I6_HALEZ|nr:hypothetical protein SAMN06266787_1097 [Halorubrum ezzemoulense]